MKKSLLLSVVLFLAPSYRAKAADTMTADTKEFLMGAVVKSNSWVMNRKKNTETFNGDVSFDNSRYSLKADNAVYYRNIFFWTLKGNVYSRRGFDDGSAVESVCDRAEYREKPEQIDMFRGRSPVKMKYIHKDGRVLHGLTDKVHADNIANFMIFDGHFRLSTDNLFIESATGRYNKSEETFTFKDSPDPKKSEGLPLSAGTVREYDFAVRAETITLYKDSRNIVLKNKVSGWIKDPKYSEMKIK